MRVRLKHDRLAANFERLGILNPTVEGATNEDTHIARQKNCRIFLRFSKSVSIDKMPAIRFRQKE